MGFFSRFVNHRFGGIFLVLLTSITIFAGVRTVLLWQVSDQIDLSLATILKIHGAGLLNASYTSRFLGRDILRTPPSEARALIGNYQKLGLLEDGRLTVLSPMGGIELLEPFDSIAAKPLAPDSPWADEAVAYYQAASYMYHNGLDRWDLDTGPVPTPGRGLHGDTVGIPGTGQTGPATHGTHPFRAPDI